MIFTEPKEFDIDPKNMYTVLDVMVAKYGEESREVKESNIYFLSVYPMYFSQFTYNVMLNHAKKLLSTKIARGGSGKHGSGKFKLPEPMTILRKFAYLSSAINYMIKQGIPLQNDAIKVVAYLREICKEKKNGKA